MSELIGAFLTVADPVSVGPDPQGRLADEANPLVGMPFYVDPQSKARVAADGVEPPSPELNAIVNPATAVYVDAGHSRWVAVEDMAARLNDVGVAKARGFSLNMANFFTTEESIGYGEAISGLTNGDHYVIDTYATAPARPTTSCPGATLRDGRCGGRFVNQYAVDLARNAGW